MDTNVHETVAMRASAPVTLPQVTAGGLTYRGATRDDAAALLSLWNRIAEANDWPHRDTLADAEEILAAPYRDIASDMLLGFDGGGLLQAYVALGNPPGDATEARVFLFGGVHPDRRGEGIGRELLAWQLARGRQVLASSTLADQLVPARLAVFYGDDAPAAQQRLYERAGLAVRRYYSELRRDLAEPVPEMQFDDMSLRLVPWTPDLDEAVRLAHNDAFRDHWNSQPQTREQWMENRRSFVSEWSFVVVDDAPDVTALVAFPGTDAQTAAALRAGEPLVVAYERGDRYEKSFSARGYAYGYTSVLGVRRAYRGRRLAVAALTAGIRAMAADGMQYAMLDVDTANPTGAAGLYAALGYEKVSGSRMASIEL